MKKVLLLLLGWLSAAGPILAEGAETSLEKMTALVGPGCVINQIDKSLIEAVGGTADLGNIVDTNLKNYASFSSAVSATVAYNPSISVKDVNRTFVAGTPTGFVIQAADGEGTNLLSANVLQMFWVETYLDGVKQETSKDTESTGGSLLDLNLITVASNGQTKISIQTTKAFDEVRLSVSGINADVLSNLRIYYAFVGQNAVQPITKTAYYPNASVHASSVTGIGNEWTTAIWNWPAQKDNLVGSGSENKGVGFGALSSLLTEPRVTINAGKIIPAGTEVGFLIETGTVLAINILNNTVLTTYDANDNPVESKTIVSVLGISAAGGGKSLVSLVTTQPCQQIKIKFGGLNVDVGGTKIYYAYTRETSVEVPESCDLKLSADRVACSTQQTQINAPAGTQWSIVSQPDGASASVNSIGLVSGMSQTGDYVVRATLGSCERLVTITRNPVSGISYDCNRPIVGDHVTTYSPPGGGCLLCLATGTTGTVENVIDTDLTNYIEYTQGLDLAGNTSVFGVQNTTQIYDASEESPRRVGFVMQATNQFLNLNLLKFFVIKTYLNDVEQESSLVEQNNAVGADLIAGMDNQIRYSFTATKNFNKVALWTAGLLNLDISKFRIYYAFEEPANNDCLVGNGSGACLSLLSIDEYGAQIAYDHTGFGGLANVGAFMTHLGNAIDGDMDSYALINKVAGIGGAATLSIKTNRIIENGYQAGFVIQDQTWVTNADLLSQVKIRTYLNGVQTGDELGTPAVLSLDLIGSGDRAYLTVLPTQPFDEIQLDLSGLLDAAINTKVFGAFLRKDTDGDGIPDCVDPNPCGEPFVLSQLDASCATYPVTISYTGGKEEATYTLWDGESEHAFVDHTATFIPQRGGDFTYMIRENGADIMHVPVTIHPKVTKWLGAISSDWNDAANWSEGVPGACTNVILLPPDSLTSSQATYYPILTDGGTYVCDSIHFYSGSEVVKTHNLTYNQAWVEIKLLPEKNFMISIPLHDTYVSDLFVGGNTYYDNRPLFAPLYGAVQRFSPSATTRVWNKTFWGNNPGGYRSLLPSGFSIKLDKGSYGSNTEFTLRFAKQDTIYYRYNSDGSISDITDTIQRIYEPGRFIYENREREMPNGVYNDTLKATGLTFVVGNPFMCHINAKKFYAANPDVKDVKVFSDHTTNANLLPAGATVLDRTDDRAQMAPMRAFFVVFSTTQTNPVIQFNADMMDHGIYSAPAAAPQLRGASSPQTNPRLLPASLSVYNREGEGVIESSEKIKLLRVFSVSGSLILEKQNVGSPAYIPLTEGINLIRVETESVTETFKLMK